MSETISSTNRDDARENAGNRPFKVTVRTLAGHSLKDNVKPDDAVAEVTDRAVKHFVAKGELTASDYALTLPRTGGEAELDPTATLAEAGVVEGDVLVLVNRKPQVDG
ncbi:EsaB/YukD family protein [Actinosynnema sp. NPDC059335]|uniref:EsaB/YukD family protein n=1 Tax=Actinosynnema sp. NPDC059335 TaxID=3346804 RepID=UPI0036717BE1